MRFDSAVFLAPHPRASTTTTRRAFLLAGGSFILGASVGGACGYSAGVRTANIGAGAARELDLAAGLAATGDADLDELRRLAIQAPVDELAGAYLIFIEQLRRTYSNDDYLWHGMQRLAQGIVEGQHRSWNSQVKQTVIQMIEGIKPGLVPARAHALIARLPELRAAR
jgi:hypothetical protein